MKSGYSLRQHNIDMQNRRRRRALFDSMPQRTDEFARKITEYVEVDEHGNHGLYIWCEHGAWHAKAIRKSDSRKVQVMDVILLNVFALLCEQLGIINEEKL